MSEIGQKLREARIEKGLTLDDVQQTTKIQKRYLSAIEEGDFEALPGNFYVRAFVKQYAQTVGLDSEALLADYEADLPKPQPVETEATEPVTVKSRQTSKVATNPKLKRLLPQIIVAVIVLAIVAVVYSIALGNRGKNRQPIEDLSSSTSVAKDSTDTNKPVVEDSDAAKKAKSESLKKASEKAAKASSEKAAKDAAEKAKAFTIKAGTDVGSKQVFDITNWPTDKTSQLQLSSNTTQAWMSVTVDGAMLYQGVLNPKQQQNVTIPATAKLIEIHTGNAPSTGVKINDQGVDLTQGGHNAYVKTINFNIK